MALATIFRRRHLRDGALIESGLKAQTQNAAAKSCGVLRLVIRVGAESEVKGRILRDKRAIRKTHRRCRSESLFCVRLFSEQASAKVQSAQVAIDIDGSRKGEGVAVCSGCLLYTSDAADD